MPVSQRLLQSHINLKAPLPDHRVEERMVTGEGNKKKKNHVRQVIKDRSNLNVTKGGEVELKMIEYEIKKA